MALLYHRISEGLRGFFCLFVFYLLTYQNNIKEHSNGIHWNLVSGSLGFDFSAMKLLEWAS